MSEAQGPLARVPLIDGRDLVIEPDAARVGERAHLISRIEEARLLFLRPETIGLRMADVGLVEYTVARPGDGQVALEALYQLRPDLRRPDLPPPAPVAPPGYQVMPLPPPQEPFAPGGPPLAGGPAAPPPGMTPPPPGVFPHPMSPPPPMSAPFPPHVEQAYGPEPNQRYATLTPKPRGAGQLISATFRLAVRRFGPLFTLAILVCFLPNLALGALSVGISVLSGDNPFAVASNPFADLQQAASGQAPTTTAATPTDTLVGLLSLLGLVATLVVAAWTVAALTLAARNAALGRPISVMGCAREGWRRMGPTLYALIITDVALLVVAIPGLGFSLGLVLALVAPPPGEAPLPAGAGVVAVTLGAGTAAITLAMLAWLWPRLALAPTAAALGMSAPIRSGWSLARGGAGRIFATLLAVGVVTTALTFPASLSQFYSSGLAVLALIPLTQMIAAPLSALARTLTLYDQRLRREEYGLFLREGIMPPATSDTITSDTAAERK